MTNCLCVECRRARGRTPKPKSTPTPAEARSIPTYLADGERASRWRNYSCADIERLHKLGMLVIELYRDGRIKSATFRPEAIDRRNRRAPLRPTIPTGTYYSREELIGSHWVWEHRPLPSLRDIERITGDDLATKADLEAFHRAIFCATQLSCIPGHHPHGVVRSAAKCSLGAKQEALARRRNWNRPKRKKATGPHKVAR